MSSVNKVIIVGNLGRDPEMRTFPSGDSVANVNIATTEKWRDKQTGETKSHTEWHRVVFNGRLAEIAGQYLRKGSLVYVEGSLRTRKWTDQSGIEQFSTEIRANEMTMLGARQGGEPEGHQPDNFQNTGSYGGQGGSNQGSYGNQGSQDSGGYAAPHRAAPAPMQQPQQQRPPAPAPRPAPAPMAPPPRAASGFDDMDDDIPF